MTLIIVLVECGLEIIPKKLRSHPAIKKNIQKTNYSSQLLDNALHHSAMKKLTNLNKRGRPDILHACLLNALGSPANKSGQLRVFVHTNLNRIFELNPEIKITRNYNRFKGLMAKMLIDGNIQTKGIALISELHTNLNNVLNRFQYPDIIMCSSKGKLISKYQDIFTSQSRDKDYVVIIGGFQKGSFSRKIASLTNNVVSISQFPLDAWIVVSKMIAFYEISHGIV